MKKTVLFPCVLLLMLVSCHQKQEQKNIDVPEPQETVVLDGVYHFNFDGFELWTLQDVQRKMSADLFKDAKKADIKQYMPDGEADAAINTFLIKKNGKYILFDTGLGLEKGGVMLDKLTLLNLRPEDISAICITHCHGDHIGGLVSKGEPVFPNAEVYCSDKELNAFKNDALTKEVVKVYDSHLPHVYGRRHALGQNPVHCRIRSHPRPYLLSNRQSFDSWGLNSCSGVADTPSRILCEI